MASPLDVLRQPLAALHRKCSQRVWGLSRDEPRHDIFQVMKHPPKELFSDITVNDLAQQFSCLRTWLQSLEESACGHEFYEPKSFLVKVVGLNGEPDGPPFHIAADQIDSSRWPHRCIPKLPTTASTRKYGTVQILQVQRKPDLMKFYQYTMATSLDEIRCRGIWHIVIGWHFEMHTALSSEALAEAVGSFLAVTRRHNINGKKSMKQLVWSSQLRAVGLKGFGGEEGFMAYALNTHVQCSGPEGWHFVAKGATHKNMTFVQMRNEVRLLSKPQWFHTYQGEEMGQGAQ